jgi:hypothetical protein
MTTTVSKAFLRFVYVRALHSGGRKVRMNGRSEFLKLMDESEAR